MLLRYLHDISTAPLRFITTALWFTTLELRMLTMRPRFAMVLVWFRPVVPRHSPYAVFLMNRDESEWIGMSGISRFIPHAHEWPRLHLPHLKHEPGAATVELRFRPSPQSTTIQPESFKRFRTALACRGGFRITKIHADVSTVLLPIISMHHYLINRGES